MFKWAPARNGDVPFGSLVGGNDSNGEPIYVARAIHSGDVVVGKLVRSHATCYVAWGGGEHRCNNYEALIAPPGGVKWVPTQGSSIPANALPAGKTSNGETLYVGRVRHGNTVTVGKVHGSHGCCYYPYGGKEIPACSYEILVYVLF